MNKQPFPRIWLGAAALALSAGLAFAQPAPRDNDQPPAPRGDRGDAPRPAGERGDRGDAPRPGGERGDRGERGRDRTPPKPEELSGTVESYNLNPRGMPDGLLIKSEGKTVQVNCPPEIGMALSRVAPEGDKVKLEVVPERGAHENSVYFLVKLTSSKGEELGMGAAQPATVHVDGVVKHLNHGRAGEVNGAILETGDFVFVGPESAEQLKLEVGSKLSIDGTEHPMPLGHKVIRATKVNGVSIVMQMEEGRGRGREGANPRGRPDGPPNPRGERNPGDKPPGPGGERNPGDKPAGPGGERNPGDKPPGPGAERQ